MNYRQCKTVTSVLRSRISHRINIITFSTVIITKSEDYAALAEMCSLESCKLRAWSSLYLLCGVENVPQTFPNFAGRISLRQPGLSPSVSIQAELVITESELVNISGLEVLQWLNSLLKFTCTQGDSSVCSKIKIKV